MTEKKKRKARKFALRSATYHNRYEYTIDGVRWLSNGHFMAPESMVTIRGNDRIRDMPAMQTIYDWHKTKELHPLDTENPEVYSTGGYETVYVVRDLVTYERVFVDSPLYEPVENCCLARVPKDDGHIFAFDDDNNVVAIIMPLRQSVMLDELADQLRETDARTATLTRSGTEAGAGETE